MEKTSDGVSLGKNIKNCFGHVKFKMFIKQSGWDVEWAIVYPVLNSEVRARLA